MSPRQAGWRRRLLAGLLGLTLPRAEALGVAEELLEDAARVRKGGRPLRARIGLARDVASVMVRGLTARAPDPGRAAGGWGRRARLAVRALSRRPGLTFLAVMTLGLGVGATVSVFGILRGFTRPLPVPDPEEVVSIRLPPRADPGSVRAVLDKEGWSSLGGVAAAVPFPATLSSEDAYAARETAARIQPGTLRLLGVEPALGRGFTPEEARPGSDGVVLLGHDLWQRRFRGAREVLGATLRVNGVRRRVVGVMPPGFGFPLRQAIWVPLGPEDELTRETELFGRLSPAASREAARDEVRALLAASRPQDLGALREVDVVRFTRGRGEAGEDLFLAGIGLVLVCLFLVACVNVANLFLTRAVERRESLAVHAAMGAGPGELILQSFTEVGAVALAGGAVGVGVAWAATVLLQARLAENFGYYWIEMRVDGTVLVFALGIATAAALVAGLLPAVRVARTDPARVLRREGTGDPGSPLRRLGRGAVVAEIAVSVFALTLTGLLLRGTLGARGTLGDLPADRIVLASLSLPPESYPDPQSRTRLRSSLLTSLRSEPGVRAGASAYLPGLEGRAARIVGPGAGGDAEGERRPLAWNAVTPGYLELVGARVLEGRLPRSTPGPGTEAVLDRKLARSLRADGLGARGALRLSGIGRDTVDVTVVGVVASSEADLGRRFRPGRLYLPLRELDPPTFRVSLLGPEPDELPELLRSRLAELDPGLPGVGLRSLAAERDFRIRAFEAGSVLTTAGAAGALAVAMVGLFGVLSFRVRKRRPELGVRLALGASRGSVAGLVVREGSGQLLAGLTLGLVGAGLVSPKLGVFLMGAGPHDPVVFGGIAGVILAVGILAVGVPARRAAGLEPARILREE